MSKRYILIASLFLLCTCNIFAQKVLHVSGEYKYNAPTHISVEQAKINAIEQAKLYLISQHFGTVIGVSNLSVTRNRNGNTNSQSVSFAETDVRGEWLETIGEPQLNLTYDQWLIVTVKIKGVIREINSAGIDINAHILKNGVDLNAESDTFCDGDDFFVSFLSPVDGYLTIYMYDMENMVRLWPKAGSGEGAQKIEAAVPYVFFQGVKTADGIRSLYHMTTEYESEINRIYLVFSTRPFTHPIDIMSGGYPMLSFNDFQSWLSRSRKSDYSMMVISKDILIKKSK